MAADKTPERRLTEVLLDISEETFVKELEPCDYHRYSGLEEAVCGWARAAPLSCILLTEQKYRRPPTEAADNTTDPSSVELNAESSASIAEHRCGSQAGRQYTLKKSTALEKQVDLLSDTAVAALQLDAGQEGTLREISLQRHRHHPSSKYSDNGLAKPHRNNPRHSNTVKNSHKPSNTLVPITNFTFFPPIRPPHLNPKGKAHACSGKKAPEGEESEEDWFMFGKKSDTRVDAGANNELHNYSAALTSIHRTCQHKSLLFSTLSVALPKTSCCMRPVK